MEDDNKICVQCVRGELIYIIEKVGLLECECEGHGYYIGYYPIRYVATEQEAIDICNNGGKFVSDPTISMYKYYAISKFIGVEKMKKPNPKDFGYVDDEHDWTLEGGEDAYEDALLEWEKEMNKKDGIYGD